MEKRMQKILLIFLAVFGTVSIILLSSIFAKIGSLNNELKKLTNEVGKLETKIDEFAIKQGETPIDPDIPVVPLEVVSEDGLTLFEDYFYVGYGFINGTLDDIANIKISAYNSFDMIVATANSNTDKFAEHKGATSYGCAIYYDESIDEYWNVTYSGAVEKTTYVKISITLKSGAKANLTIYANE